MRSILAIIPTKDRLDLLRTAVGGLTQHCPDAAIRVVDAGTDRSYHWAEQQGLETVSSPDLTFAQAVNAGIAAGIEGVRAILLLNNDVVIHSDFLKPMLDVIDLVDNRAVVGARLLYPNGLIQHAGVGFDLEGNPYALWEHGPAEHPEAMKRRYLPAVTFACVLIPTALWLQVGPLDEGYRNAYEDIDWCLRAREAGAHVIYEPTATLTHLAGQTPGRFDANAEAERHFQEKWVRTGRLFYVLGSWPFQQNRGGK